jgi:hypothetical protein
MERQRQIIHGKDIEPARVLDFGLFGRGAPAAGEERQPERLPVNECIERLTRLFSPALRGRLTLHTALGDRELPIVGDPAGIVAIFFSLVAWGARLTPGGTMTVVTTLLPVHIGLSPKRAGSGCALLSFRAAGRSGERMSDLSIPGHDELLCALTNVRDTVKRYHGSFRLNICEKEVAFNVYLPVAGVCGAASGRQREGL